MWNLTFEKCQGLPFSRRALLPQLGSIFYILEVICYLQFSHRDLPFF